MFKTRILLAVAAVALAGCDAATQIAGEAVEGEIRNAVAAQCEEVAQGASFVAGHVAEVCQCSTDRFMADPDLTLDDVTRDNIEGIVNACARTTAPESGTWTETTPTEEIGG